MTPQSRALAGPINLLLRAEGAAMLAAASVAYAQTGAHWGWFAGLFLAPDLMMLGYLHNTRTGAAVYNLGHTCLLPAALLAASLLFGWSATVAVALIWVAHIGFDRMLGYGLKYATGFKHSHLKWG